MTSLSVAPDMRLSAAMRDGSRAEHQAAESSAFLVRLLRGEVEAAGYVAYLSRLRGLYEALEDQARRNRHDNLLAAVHDPALERAATLEADLAHWSRLAGGDGRPETSPAVADYVRRLEDASAWGGLLLAHHYTRYLGDLSGGQAMRSILDRAYGLRGGGLAFYEFPGIARIKAYKDDYRARLDRLPLTGEQKARVVEEVRAAFGLNRALLAELADA